MLRELQLPLYYNPNSSLLIIQFTEHRLCSLFVSLFLKTRRRSAVDMPQLWHCVFRLQPSTWWFGSTLRYSLAYYYELFSNAITLISFGDFSFRSHFSYKFLFYTFISFNVATSTSIRVEQLRIWMAYICRIGLETWQKSWYYVFLWVSVNLCANTAIELIVFLYNEVIAQSF